MILKKKSLLTIAILSCISLSAQNFRQAGLDSFFDALEKNNKAIGSICVLKEGEVVYRRATGYADYGVRIKADTFTKYRIGSISKLYTAIVTLRAAEKGLLKLNGTIEKYFPTLPNKDKITIRMLLNHHSGIPNITDDTAYLSYNHLPITEDEVVKKIVKLTPKYKHDTSFKYSNSNYILLSYILEKVYNLKFAAIIDSEIVKRIELEQTYYGSTISVNRFEARSYTYTDQWMTERETNMSLPLGAGGMVSNPFDLILSIRGLFLGQFISTASLQEMLPSDGYGLGIMHLPYYNHRGFGHTGGIDGFSSMLVYYPGVDIGVAMCFNGLNYDLNAIAANVVNVAFGLPNKMPDIGSYKPMPSDISSYKGTYTNPNLAIKINISESKTGSIKLQATDQPAFDLDATARHEFKLNLLSLKVIMNPIQKEMLLIQNGKEMKFYLTK